MEEEPYLSEINNRHASKLDEWGWLEHGEYRLSLLLSTIPDIVDGPGFDLQVDLFVVVPELNFVFRIQRKRIFRICS